MKFIILMIAIVAGLFFLDKQGIINLSAKKVAETSEGTDVIEFYATSWCGYCKKARQLFDSNKLRYLEYDIEKDYAANQRFKKLGGRGIPLVVANNKIIRGYNAAELNKLANDSRYKR